MYSSLSRKRSNNELGHRPTVLCSSLVSCSLSDICIIRAYMDDTIFVYAWAGCKMLGIMSSHKVRD